MGSFSLWHWLVVLLIVVLVFGTKKLKNMGSDVGGAVNEFKKAMKDGQEKDGQDKDGQGKVADEADNAGTSSSASTGTTIEGEVTSKTTEKTKDNV